MKKKYNLDDEDFEVVEQVVDDFNYLYEDEAEVIRNRKVIHKFKFFSILISILTCIIVIFIAGAIQMSIYNTDQVVTKDVIELADYKNYSKDYFDFAFDFYSVVNAGDDENVNIIQGGLFGDIYNNYAIGSETIEGMNLQNFATNLKNENLTVEALSNDINNIQKFSKTKNEKILVANSALLDSYNYALAIVQIVETQASSDMNGKGKVIIVDLNKYLDTYIGGLAPLVEARNLL